MKHLIASTLENKKQVAINILLKKIWGTSGGLYQPSNTKVSGA